MDSARTVHIPARLLRIVAASMVIASVTTACPGDPEGEPQAARSTITTAPQAAGSFGSPGRSPVGGAGGDGGEENRVRIRDRDGQRTTSGRVPGYVELRGVSIDGDADFLDVDIRLAATLPDAMPDPGTSLRVTLDVLAASRKRYSFVAEASDQGWAAFATGGASADFPGDFEIDGEAVRMRIDRSYLPDAPTFRWLVNVAWTSAGGSDYGFDVLPVQGYARYPGG